MSKIYPKKNKPCKHETTKYLLNQSYKCLYCSGYAIMDFEVEYITSLYEGLVLYHYYKINDGFCINCGAKFGDLEIPCIVGNLEMFRKMKEIKYINLN